MLSKSWHSNFTTKVRKWPFLFSELLLLKTLEGTFCRWWWSPLSLWLLSSYIGFVGLLIVENNRLSSIVFEQWNLCTRWNSVKCLAIYIFYVLCVRHKSTDNLLNGWVAIKGNGKFPEVAGLGAIIKYGMFGDSHLLHVFIIQCLADNEHLGV